MHHRHQAFPADDLGLRKAISQYYCDDKKISADNARQIANKWGKWKGLAAYYILVSYLET
jgi:DNA-3-methyladenine glycosylase II